MAWGKLQVPDAKSRIFFFVKRRKETSKPLREKSNLLYQIPIANMLWYQGSRLMRTTSTRGTTLEINSPQLLAAFKEVIKYYPGESLDFSMKFSIDDPFMMLVHHLDDLRRYRETTTDATTKMHIALLLDYLKEEAGSKGVEINEMINAGKIHLPASLDDLQARRSSL